MENELFQELKENLDNVILQYQNLMNQISSLDKSLSQDADWANYKLELYRNTIDAEANVLPEVFPWREINPRYSEEAIQWVNNK